MPHQPSGLRPADPLPPVAEAGTFSYLIRNPENSRRLRSFPAWCTLRAYGITGADRQSLQHYLQLLSDRGRFFLTATELYGRAGMRAASVNRLTEPEDAAALTQELAICLELLDATVPAPR